MQCKSIHVLSVRHNVPTSGRSTVIKNRFLINKNHQQLLGSQSKFLKWIKRVQMCNGANYSTVHRHDLVEQTIWIWRYHRWHCYMPHNMFWEHEFPFFKMSRSCFCGENACSRCLNPRQLYEGNTGQYLAILGSTTIVGNRVLNASVLESKAGHTSNYLLAQFGFTRHLQRYPFCLLPEGQTFLWNCTAKFK